jgi:hypothetical protein
MRKKNLGGLAVKVTTPLRYKSSFRRDEVDFSFASGFWLVIFELS